MSTKTCTACGGKMVGIGAFPLQKGKFSAFFGHWSNIWEGALEVSAYCCESCRRLEFYLADDADEADVLEKDEDHIAQVECPFCGSMHDLDDAICRSAESGSRTERKTEGGCPCKFIKNHSIYEGESQHGNL